MDPLVTIVIPVYNGSNYMREAIHSALTQTYSNIEIIVVNDGSTDGGKTRDIACSYGDKIMYFEKSNGGVSTALNMAIKNMHGQYFSWLSHDDVYMPDKIQTEIDALRAAGDMSRIVMSDWISMRMPERTTYVSDRSKFFRQEFLETGAFTTAFRFIHGCTLLIPKYYFDVYGGFNEEHRCVQDYEKWFEIFRGKRVIYVHKPLVVSRKHPDQTTRTMFDRLVQEERWLYRWIVESVDNNDIAGSGLTDMYHFYSAQFQEFFFSVYSEASEYCLEKLRELPESHDINDRIEKLSKHFQTLLDREDTYFLKAEEDTFRFCLRLHGIDLNQPEKFLTPEQINQLQATKKPLQIIALTNMRQMLYDAPILKDAIKQLVKAPA